MKITDIPYQQRKRFKYPSKYGKPQMGVVTYCFDKEGNELGTYNPLTSRNGEVNTTTAGRKWSDELKSKLL